MTTARQLWHTTRRAGIVLVATDTGLAFDAPAGAMTPELRGLLQNRKAELRGVVLGEYVPAALALVLGIDGSERRRAIAEWFDERCGARKTDGVERGEVQKKAYCNLCRAVERNQI